MPSPEQHPPAESDKSSDAPPASDSRKRNPFTGLRFGDAACLLWKFVLQAKRSVIAIAAALLSALVVFVVFAIIHLNGRPDLHPWHEIELEEEFTDRSEVSSFQAYLELEDRLFTELDQKIYSESSSSSVSAINRYHRGSAADPGQHGNDGNRSFELIADANQPSCSVLLLHGMSDSPYSLRRLGDSLHARDAHVVGLRLPGHGTAPVGLTTLDWKDMHAATVLAAKHLKDANPDAPLYLVGYSNGGALAIHYAIESLADENLPAADGIVLISPAIGVSPMARLAVWQGRVGTWLGLDKLAWNSIRPEYDPHKYNSFAINAGHQVYRITKNIDADLGRLAARGELEKFPPVLAFQSVVDATVSTPDLVKNLFARLPERPNSRQHELVLFDINYNPLVDSLMVGDPGSRVKQVLLSGSHDSAITIFSNRTDPAAAPIAARWENGTIAGSPETPGIRWPAGLYSLSHISLPFSPEDSLYGNQPPSLGTDGSPYSIGNAVLRGERGVLKIPAADQLRLRWNPFYPWLEGRINDFVVPSSREP